VIVQDADGAMVWFEQVSPVTEKGAASEFGDPTAPIIREAVPLLVTVTVCEAVEPAITVPKGTCRSFAGATESVTEMAGTATAAPVPLTFIVIGLFAVSLLGMLKLSVKVPVVVGANVTRTVHDAAGAMVWFEQVSFMRVKGAASGFVDPSAPITKLAVPLLVTVTVWLADDPALMLPKGSCRSVVGATESVTVMDGTGTAAPVPLTFIVTELFAASLLGMLKLSVKAPVAVGEKETFRVQEAAGAMVWFEQPSFVMEKGAARGFVEPTAPTSRLAFPEFVTVTVCEADEPALTLPKGTCRSVVGATESVTVMAGAGGGVVLVTVKELVATISSPWLGLLGSGLHRGPKNPPDLSYWFPYQEAL
jgi:hypothetical protein